MSLAVIHSRALEGLNAAPVSVEVHLANGLPAFTLVGLAETEVKGSRACARAALLNNGLPFPHNKRIRVNLAPADLPKEGGRFELPIALGIPAASAAEAALAPGSTETLRHARALNDTAALAALPDMDEVKGQADPKRALEIAGGGELSLLLVGPPGSGKSMLAQRLPGLLPPLSEDEALESAAILSLAGQFDATRWGRWKPAASRSPVRRAAPSFRRAFS